MSDESIKWNCTSGLCVSGGDSCSWPPTGFDGYTMEMLAQHRARLKAGGCEYRVWVRKLTRDGNGEWSKGRNNEWVFEHRGGWVWNKNHMTAPTMQRLEASISRAINSGYELMGEIEIFRYSQEVSDDS